MTEKQQVGDTRLNDSIKKLDKDPYNVAAMEILFTLEAEELDLFHDDPENFDPSEFMKVSRYIFREINGLMVKLGMYDKDQTGKVRFNQNYIENCNAITTELLTQSARRDPEAMNRLALILHDYLSPYSRRIKEMTEEAKPNVVNAPAGTKSA